MKQLIIFLFVALAGCQTPEGFSGGSADIAEAKKRGVFISEYFAYPNPFNINHSLQFEVKQAWMERHWAHGENDATIFQDGYQLCINTTKEDETKIDNLAGTFGISPDHYLRPSGNDSFMGDFDSLPSDTIKYFLQQGHNLRVDSTEKRDVIGLLVLVRKK